MRKLILSGLFAAALVGTAYAANDRDRHANFTDGKVAAATTAKDAPAECKPFYGTEDNLSACNDWCGQYKTENAGATCTCDEGKCAADDHS